VAKRKGRRRFNLRKVRIASGIAVGALAAGDVIASAGTNAVADKLRIISVDCAYGVSDLAAQVDDSFQFGWAHSDYTAAEIEECLEAGGAIDLGDKIAQERGNRLVREVGMISSSGLTASGGGGFPFNDGRRVKTRLNWLLSAGDTLNLWVRNASGVIYTTGSSLQANGDIWVKD